MLNNPLKEVMKLLKTISLYLGMALTQICIFGPQVYNFLNPELTQMQVLIQFWWSYAIGISVGLFLSWFLNKES